MKLKNHINKICKEFNATLTNFVLSRRGKNLLIVGGYTFCVKVNGAKTRWVCSTHNHRGCRATSYIKSRQGNTQLCVDGYTFCAKRINGPKVTWVCSSHNYKGCRATVNRLSIDGYTFCVKGVSGHKTRWVCSTHNCKGCKAIVHTVEDTIFVKSLRRGSTLLWINGYTFCYQSKSKSKIRWVCSTHNSRKCYASLNTSLLNLNVAENSSVLTALHSGFNKKQGSGQDGYALPIATKNVMLWPIFTTSQRGNTQLCLGRYTFYNKKGTSNTLTAFKKRWVCSTHFPKGCKAAVYTVDDVIVSVKNIHNHEPSNKCISRGRRLLIVDEKRFTFHRTGYNSRLRWRCTRHSYGCKAVVFTMEEKISLHVNETRFITNKRGVRLLMLNGYYYSVHYKRRIDEEITKFRWYCHNGRSVRCKSIVYTLNDQIISVKESRRGTDLLKYDSYTYCKKYSRELKTYSKEMKARWVCSTHYCKGCRAHLWTYGKDIIRKKLDHNHQPSSNVREVCDLSPREAHDTTQRAQVLLSTQSQKQSEMGLLDPPSLRVSRSHPDLAMFSFSARGNPILTLAGFRFCKDNMTATKIRWKCAQANHGCRAVIHTVIDGNVIVKYLKMVISKHGNPLISFFGYKYSKQRTYDFTFIRSKRGNLNISIAGCAFSRHRKIGFKTRWQCSTHTNFTFMISKRGNLNIRIAGFAYSRHRTLGSAKTRWQCSTHTSKGCVANIYTTEDDKKIRILKHNLNHNHKPPY
ncbi:Uncharacterized protein OBRU01_18001 [Operophtera brumata]|uniref:FLYWCH-type domain-containing protein n=1 Tax=Operophtera brumata TaxID=104452 RepID=A0A0L7L059_OPEBR|nr:Uncharacterized protein OBRU01_18001 [Operophtera brumata]